MTEVLALDPGERVGWARATVDDDGRWAALRHGITPLREMALSVHDQAHKYDLIICESWRLYPHMAQSFVGSAFPSVQFIGMVRLSCWHTDTKLVMQAPSIKANADKTMKKLRPFLFGMVTRPSAHDDAHDMDAIRHLWAWTFKNTEGIPT